MRALIVFSLFLFLIGCHSAPSKPEPSSSQVQAEPFKYEPNGREEFVFVEKPEDMQKYGYDRFCPKTSYFTCPERFPYKDFVGIRGYFESDQPAAKSYGYDLYRVVLQNGITTYFVANERYGGKYGEGSPIKPYAAVNSTAEVMAGRGPQN